MHIPYTPPEPLGCQQIRELDVLAIEHVGLPGIVLMENAGRHIAEAIYPLLANPTAGRVAVLCGAGNNGGDGFVVARHLYNAGVGVDVILTKAPEKLDGDADTNRMILERMGLTLLRADSEDGLEPARAALEDADVIVDALLGTGAKGAPRGPMAPLVECANGCARARRVAIDIPSGLDGDSGEVHEPCFRADLTVTMVAAKQGFQIGNAPDVVGRILVVDIGVPRDLIPGRRESGLHG